MLNLFKNVYQNQTQPPLDQVISSAQVTMVIQAG